MRFSSAKPFPSIRVRGAKNEVFVFSPRSNEQARRQSILIFNPAETSSLLSRCVWPSEVLNADDVFGPEPAIAALPSHIRGQAPSILFRQDKLPPKDVIVIVITNLGQHHKIAF